MDEIRDEVIDEEKRYRPHWFRIIAVVIIASFIGGLGGYYVGTKLVATPAEAAVIQEVTITPSDSLNTVSAVAKKAMDSVVGITTVQTQRTFFFEEDVSGVGSGVIVNSDGYILTNSHVVADGNAKEIKVLLNDGEEIPGTVLWNDSLLDLAVVKVDKKGLTAAELGDSESLTVGELAVAIGNPLGLEFERSVTSGIISGLNRSVRVDASSVIDGIIQTDASINPGNSGGPLLNSQGQVIGINTAKITSAEGLGFAIPINQAKHVIEEVISTGSYEGVTIGITGVSVSEYEARLGIDLSVDEGVVIIEVMPDSNASRAGIQNGDIITGIGGKAIGTMTQLRRQLYSYNFGDKTELDVVRSGNVIKIEIEFKK